MKSAENNPQVADTTIVDIYRALNRHKWLLLLITLTSLLGAVALSFILPPVYRSEVLLAPSEALSQRNMNGSGLSALNTLKSITGKTSDSSTEALAIIQSRRFTEQFIQKHKLLPILFADKFDSKAGKWIVPNPPALEDGYLKFSRKVLKISVDEKTGYIRVRVDWATTELAEQWANDIVEDINSEMSERAIKEAQLDMEFLEKKLLETNIPDIRAGLTDLVRDRMEKSMLAVNRPNYAFKVIDPGAKSKYRYQPKRSLIVVGGSILGFIFALAVIALIETIRKIREA